MIARSAAARLAQVEEAIAPPPPADDDHWIVKLSDDWTVPEFVVFADAWLNGTVEVAVSAKNRGAVCTPADRETIEDGLARDLIALWAETTAEERDQARQSLEQRGLLPRGAP